MTYSRINYDYELKKDMGGRALKAAIFDLDGTLLDSMWVWEDLVDDYLFSMGIKSPEGMREVLKKLSLLEGCHYLKNILNLEKSAEDINEDMEKILESYYRDKLLLKPYVFETLESFKNRDVKMILATATDDALVAQTFSRIPIGHYFSFIQTSNALGIGKKDPRFFQIAIEKLEENPRDIWVFEDALHCMISAKKCDLNVVGLKDESNKEDWEDICKIADMAIDNLENLDVDKLF